MINRASSSSFSHPINLSSKRSWPHCTRLNPLPDSYRLTEANPRPGVSARGSRQTLFGAIKSSTAVAHAGEAQLQITDAVADLKEQLKAAFRPVKHRGLFGLQAAELERIKAAAEALEAHNPLSNPTEHLDLLAGRWTVCFSTIRVTGSRRVKLGLRDLVQIGDLTQEIDPSQNTAVNRVAFNVPAFGIRGGELILKASYQTSSSCRVTIELEQAALVPQRLQSVFEANFDLLLSIFNPAGFLDITYCDSNFRCGRDDKGNLFVLERP